MDRKKYIRELFEVVSTHDILILNKDNQLIRLNVPFTVLVVHEVPGLCIGDLGSVTGIKMGLELIDIYVVNGRPYYHSNLKLWICKNV
jgi:hypothetical protein